MSSLLTNNSAMVALQTLRTINKDMGQVQSEISTGKKIANAKDNAAIWGITATMQTDVSGFKAISESLALGTATLTVGRDASETITGLLDKLKARIVAAQEENVDRKKIQADVVALRDQILTVVSGAQFNGLNLLNGKDTVEILASLDRSSDGVVTASHIAFDEQNLTTDASVWNTAGTDITTARISKVGGVVSFANQSTVTLANTTTIDTATTGVAGSFRLRFTVTDAVDTTDIKTFDLQVDAAGAATQTAAQFVAEIQAAANLSGNAAELAKLGISVTSATANLTVTSTNARSTVAISYVGGGAGGEPAPTFTGTDNLTTWAPTALAELQETATLYNTVVNEGDTYRLSLGGVNYDYVARSGETVHDVSAQLALKVNADPANNLSVRLGEVDDPDTENAILYISNTSGTTTAGGAAIAYGAVAANTDGVLGGGLEGLDMLNVTTQDGARAALQAVERMVQASINAAAAFGSAQGRIDTQSEFVSRIIDGLTSGIGALVDADMEAASARLQALQVQQQLGVQALSIANQQPQNILALFRQ